MDDMKRRVVSRTVIPGLALVVALVAAFGLFGPAIDAEEGSPDVSADDVLAEATFYVA
jgi:hypothetical protein